MAVAREMGRPPQEIWQEALTEWLLAHEIGLAGPSAPPLLQSAQRQQEWGEIEATMQALRAS
jgi:hypothetical protein